MKLQLFKNSNYLVVVLFVVSCLQSAWGNCELDSSNLEKSVSSMGKLFASNFTETKSHEGVRKSIASKTFLYSCRPGGESSSFDERYFEGEIREENGDQLKLIATGSSAPDVEPYTSECAEVMRSRSEVKTIDRIDSYTFKTTENEKMKLRMGSRVQLQVSHLRLNMIIASLSKEGATELKFEKHPEWAHVWVIPTSYELFQARDISGKRTGAPVFRHPLKR